MTVADFSAVAMTAVSDWTKAVGVPITIAIIGLAGTLIVAAMTFIFGRITDASARRRDGYAAATRTLVAYTEYAWRIRRRTSDASDELARLADLGHSLQQDLAYYESWIRSENAWVGKIFDEVRHDLAEAIAPACNEAWCAAPVTSAAGMTLGQWGPRGLDEHLRRLETAVAFRFGWRRALGMVRWHPNVARRPEPASPAPVAVIADEDALRSSA